MKNVLHRLELAALRLMGRLLAGSSWETAQRRGEALGRLASRLAPKRTRLALKNLETAFPQSSEGQRRAWALASWENLGRVGAECLWAESRSREDILEKVRFEGLEKVRDSLRQGGVLLHLGHFANWEAAGLAFSAHGLPLSVVTRRIANPLLDQHMKDLRSRFGARMISHKHPFFGCVRALKEGRALAILMDQNMPKGELYVPFFGRLAATTPLTAMLAHRTGRPVYALRLRREGRVITGRFEGPVEPGSDAAETAARLTEIIERWVRESPQDWFWLHNRWKRRPASELAAAEARP